MRSPRLLLLVGLLLLLLPRLSFGMSPNDEEKDKERRKQWEKMLEEATKGMTPEERKKFYEKLKRLGEKKKKERDRLRERHKRMKEAQERLKKQMPKELREKVDKLEKEHQEVLYRWAGMRTFQVHLDDLMKLITPKQKAELKRFEGRERFHRQWEMIRKSLHDQIPRRERERIAALPEAERLDATKKAMKPVKEKMYDDARSKVVSEIEAQFRKSQKDLKKWLADISKPPRPRGKHDRRGGPGRDRRGGGRR